MALVPCTTSTCLWRDWWEDFERPHRLLDHYFHLGLKRDDFFHSLVLPPFDWYFRPWDGLWERRVTLSKKTTTVTTLPCCHEYSIAIDVKLFSPHEIMVKTIGNSIIIEAKHEERKPCDSLTTTEFMRRYELPSTHDINRVMCNLTTDGVLTISAPKIGSPPSPLERIVPIDRLRFPAIKS